MKRLTKPAVTAAMMLCLCGVAPASHASGITTPVNLNAETPTIARGQNVQAFGKANSTTSAYALSLARSKAKNRIYQMARDRGLRVKSGSFYDGVYGVSKTSNGRYNAHITVHAILQ